MQHDTGKSDINKLDETVQGLQQILNPEDEAPLATQIADAKKTLTDFQKWSKDVDRRFRRIAPLDSQFSDVQLELERLRKLFEFVEKVLPSDAAKAMSFFNKTESENAVKRRSSIASIKQDMATNIMNQTFSGAIQTELIDKMAQTLGPDSAFEMHRDQLSNEVKSHEERMGHEFANLATAIKALQREVQQSAGQTGDLIDRLARVEKRRPATLPESAAVPAAGAGAAVEAPVQVPVSPAARSDTTPKANAITSDSVSRDEVTKLLEDAKNDIRNWLDVLHSTTLKALQQKADSNQLNSILSHLQNAMGADALTTESFALLAKRALLGKCASCDAHMNVDTSKEKRPVPVNKPSPWPSQHSHAPGPLQIRPPLGQAGQSAMPASGIAGSASMGKLPRIPDPRAAKEFPKNRVFKTPSQPEIRQVRTLEQSNDG
jgi:hypothetical protein